MVHVFGNGRITHLMFGESFGALEMARKSEYCIQSHSRFRIVKRRDLCWASFATAHPSNHCPSQDQRNVPWPRATPILRRKRGAKQPPAQLQSKCLRDHHRRGRKGWNRATHGPGRQARSWRLHRCGLRHDRHHLDLPYLGNPEAFRTATRRRRRSRKVTRGRDGRYARTVPSLKRLHRGDVANLRSRTRGFAAESTSWRRNARRLLCSRRHDREDASSVVASSPRQLCGSWDLQSVAVDASCTLRCVRTE